MKKYNYLLLTLFVFAFSSCKNLQEVTFSQIENVNVTSISQKGVEATITARIKNPNKMAFTIYKSEMNVNIGGIDAGKAHLAKNVRIKRKSENSYTFNIKSDFSNLSFADMPRIMAIATSKNVKVGLKGDLKVGKIFVKKSFPVDITKNVPLEGM